jgi:hypothetical protein
MSTATTTRTPVDYFANVGGETVQVTAERVTKRGVLCAGTVTASSNVHRVGLTVWFSKEVAQVLVQCESIEYPLLPGGGEGRYCDRPVDRPAFPGYGRCAHGHVTALA